MNDVKLQPTPELLVVMYHHIHGPGASDLQGLHGPTGAEFEAQLCRIQQQYEFIGVPRLLSALEGQGELPEKSALITFDDGTRDNHDVAFPVLTRLAVPAIFFVITQATDERALAAVHARHLIARAIGEHDFRATFTTRMNARLGGSDWTRAVSEETARHAYRWDDVETARFKYAVNFQLPAAVRNEVLSSLFAECVGDARAFADRLYLTWEQARRMQEAGMAIGGHSHTHEALGMMTVEAADADIAACSGLLGRELGRRARAFSYPFGKPEHFSAKVIASLERYGFVAGFANIQGLNQLPLPEPAQRFQIRRFDPKDLPVLLPTKSRLACT